VGGGVVSSRGGYGVGDQVVLVAVEVGQRAGNRVLDGVGVDSLAPVAVMPRKDSSPR
jgi:hypothetical protein